MELDSKIMEKAATLIEAFSGPVLPAADSMPGAPPEAACSEAAPPSPRAEPFSQSSTPSKTKAACADSPKPPHSSRQSTSSKTASTLGPISGIATESRSPIPSSTTLAKRTASRHHSRLTPLKLNLRQHLLQ